MPSISLAASWYVTGLLYHNITLTLGCLSLWHSTTSDFRDVPFWCFSVRDVLDPISPPRAHVFAGYIVSRVIGLGTRTALWNPSYLTLLVTRTFQDSWTTWRYWSVSHTEARPSPASSTSLSTTTRYPHNNEENKNILPFCQRCSPPTVSSHNTIFIVQLGGGADLGRTMWGVLGLGTFGIEVKGVPDDRRIVTTTRSHSNKVVTDCVAAMEPHEVIRVGGAGNKVSPDQFFIRLLFPMQIRQRPYWLTIRLIVWLAPVTCNDLDCVGRNNATFPSSILCR